MFDKNCFRGDLFKFNSGVISPPTSPKSATTDEKSVSVLLNYIKFFANYLRMKDLCVIRSLCRLACEIVDGGSVLSKASLTVDRWSEDSSALFKANRIGMAGLVKVKINLRYCGDKIMLVNFLPKYSSRVIVHLIESIEDDNGFGSMDATRNIFIDLSGIRIYESLSVITSATIHASRVPVVRLVEQQQQGQTSIWPDSIIFFRCTVTTDCDQPDSVSLDRFDKISFCRCTVMGTIVTHESRASSGRKCHLTLDNTTCSDFEITSADRWVARLTLYNSCEVKLFEPPLTLTHFVTGFTMQGSWGTLNPPVNHLTDRLSKVLEGCSRSLLNLELYMINSMGYTLDLTDLKSLSDLTIHECCFSKVVPPVSQSVTSISVHGFYYPPWGIGSALSEIAGLWEKRRSNLKSLSLHYIRSSDRTVLDLSNVDYLESLDCVDCSFYQFIPPGRIRDLSIHGHLVSKTPFGAMTNVNNTIGPLWRKNCLINVLLRDIHDVNFQICEMPPLQGVIDVEECIFAEVTKV
eukprot:GHVH01005281.1.p1 GENE.GHVH01005281.1~~GHVH01005281.1.p1  ORF type:complete len:520 (+),score=50.25 GHVH01005281.1:52-1611(+)